MTNLRSARAIYGERIAVALIVVGILFMIQPFVLNLLAYGFVLTLIGLIAFTVASHLS